MTNLRKFSLYNLLSVIGGAQAAILIFVHDFGNPGVDVVAGSILGGLAVVSFVAHTWFASLVITVPSGVYSFLQTADGIVVTVLASSGIITQYVGSVSSALTPWVALILQGGALVAGLFANLFKTTAALRAAKANTIRMGA
jgi:hypothetical protein